MLNNALKYAHPTEIGVQLSILEDNTFACVFYHNGQGIETPLYQTYLNKKGSFGLKNIENRVQFMMGEIQFNKRADSVFEVVIQVPINKKKGE